jgi:hypothetical protein
MHVSPVVPFSYRPSAACLQVQVRGLPLCRQKGIVGPHETGTAKTGMAGQARKVNPRAIWLRTNQISATPGISDSTVIAITMPISV